MSESMNPDQPEMKQEGESVSREVIVLCAVLSALYTFLVGIMPPIMLPIPSVFLRWLLGLCWLALVFLVYPSLHAKIGQVIVASAIRLSGKIDSVYGLAEKDKWGNWKRDLTIIFGTNWPITWVWLVFLAVAVIIGESFRSVWKV